MCLRMRFENPVSSFLADFSQSQQTQTKEKKLLFPTNTKCQKNKHAFKAYFGIPVTEPWLINKSCFCFSVSESFLNQSELR